ncbi:MAG: hypothetical protein JW776_16810 [Candidatus Lokiarchaeota archaeon]|nr:hypothetical protein [Candidatus Lokiarchaeota archaeon]
MSSIPTDSFEDISTEFSHYFQVGSLTSSYKPVLLKSILFCIKRGKTQRMRDIHFISMDNIAIYFLKFYFSLYRRFNIKQLTSKNNKITIYRIIDRYIDEETTKLYDRDISDEIVDKIKKALYRNVIYLLRQDSYFYEFYDSHHDVIALPREIKDEQDFNHLLKKLDVHRREIAFIGIPDKIVLFIEMNRPILDAAINANLALFLEKINTVPNLNIKILAADGSFDEIRNISPLLKEKLCAYQNDCCFYCGKNMSDTAEADHFVPYNYLFDSQIWNIVGACEKCNGKKSNHVVQEEYLRKIQERNLEEEFRHVFFQDRLDSLEFAQNMNKILEQHYRNCLLNFKLLKKRNLSVDFGKEISHMY